MSKSHLYYHFDSKDELLAALFADRAGRILADKDLLFAGAEVLDDTLVEKVLDQGVARLMAAHPRFWRITVLECFRPGGRSDLAFGFLHRVSDDTMARFRRFGWDVDGEELASAVVWFVLLPVLSELLVGGERARVLGLDPAGQHAIFERQLAQVYTGYLARLRASGVTS